MCHFSIFIKTEVSLVNKHKKQTLCCITVLLINTDNFVSLSTFVQLSLTLEHFKLSDKYRPIFNSHPWSFTLFKSIFNKFSNFSTVNCEIQLKLLFIFCVYYVILAH